MSLIIIYQNLLFRSVGSYSIEILLERRFSDENASGTFSNMILRNSSVNVSLSKRNKRSTTNRDFDPLIIDENVPILLEVYFNSTQIGYIYHGVIDNARLLSPYNSISLKSPWSSSVDHNSFDRNIIDLQSPQPNNLVMATPDKIYNSNTIMGRNKVDESYKSPISVNRTHMMDRSNADNTKMSDVGEKFTGIGNDSSDGMTKDGRLYLRSMLLFTSPVCNIALEQHSVLHATTLTGLESYTMPLHSSLLSVGLPRGYTPFVEGLWKQGGGVGCSLIGLRPFFSIDQLAVVGSTLAVKASHEGSSTLYCLGKYILIYR